MELTKNPRIGHGHTIQFQTVPYNAPLVYYYIYQDIFNKINIICITYYYMYLELMCLTFKILTLNILAERHNKIQFICNLFSHMKCTAIH
jgi:hypothetical protein